MCMFHAETTMQYPRPGSEDQTFILSALLPTHLRGTSRGHDGGDAGSCGVALNNLVSQRCSLL